MSDEDIGKNGCGCIVACIIMFYVGSCVKDVFNEVIEERRAKEAQKVQEETRNAEMRKREEEAEKAKAAAEARIMQREDNIRSFVLKEAPKLWETYQNLQAEIEDQDKKIDELCETLKIFSKDPNSDPDFKQICAMRDDMVVSLRTMRMKIEDAYLAARKYEAMPSRKDYDSLLRKSLEDGIQEAESAIRRFRTMTTDK